MTLLAIFDSVDDTKIVQKVILEVSQRMGVCMLGFWEYRAACKYVLQGRVLVFYFYLGFVQ